jgi:hypothetical protein
MSIEDSIGFLDEGKTCIVCGKGLNEGEALMILHEGEKNLPICCPLCQAAFHEDPNRYLQRLANREFLRVLRDATDKTRPQ